MVFKVVIDGAALRKLMQQKVVVLEGKESVPKDMPIGGGGEQRCTVEVSLSTIGFPLMREYITEAEYERRKAEYESRRKC